MNHKKVKTLLQDEILMTLVEAAEDFGGVVIPLRTVRFYVYEGVNGVKLETIRINRRYTSKEAIQRFLERRHGITPSKKPKIQRLTQAQIDAGLKRHGLVK